MQNPFIENKVWSEGTRQDCYSVSFGQTDETVETLYEKIRALIRKKYGTDGTQQDTVSRCEGFVIPIGDEPLLPEQAYTLTVRQDGQDLYGLYFAIFDLDYLLNLKDSTAGRMVAIAQIKQGYSEDADAVKRGAKIAKYFKRKIGRLCTPWEDLTGVHDVLSDEYSIQDPGKRLTTASKVILATLGAAAASYIAYRLISDGDEEALENQDEPLLDSIAANVLLDDAGNAEVSVPIFFEPLRDGVARRSASRIGKMIGMTGQQVNLALRDAGFLSGEPGNWSITEKGAPFAILRCDSLNGKSQPYPMWEESIAWELGNPDEHLAKINEIRKSIDLPPLESL